MTVTLTPCDAVGTACTVATHDHWTTVDRDGAICEARPMLCNDCAAPTHYNSTVEDYFHDSAPSCFLAYGPEWTDLVGTVLSGPTLIAGETWSGVFDGVRPSEHDGQQMAMFLNGRIGQTEQRIFGFPDLAHDWSVVLMTTRILIAVDISDDQMTAAYGSTYYDADDMVPSFDARLSEVYCGRDNTPVRARLVALGDFSDGALQAMLNAAEIGADGIDSNETQSLVYGSLATMQQMLGAEDEVR